MHCRGTAKLSAGGLQHFSLLPVAIALRTSPAMCILCCSHKQLELPHPPRCDPRDLYHVAHFAIGSGVLFPGESSNIDVYAANSLRLMADIRTSGLRPLLHNEPQWPSATLLSRVIAISAEPNSPYGAIVAFSKQGSPVTGFDNFFRFRVAVVGRYKLARPSTMHCSYSCVLVSLICEEPSIRLPCPDRAFPFLSPSPLRRSARSRIITRSTAAALRSSPRLRSSAQMGGLRYAHWRSVQPEVLVARACAEAAEHVSKFKPFVADEVPNEPCPSWWSFWLCQCLSLDTSQSFLYQLHSETSVVRRLQEFIGYMLHGEEKTPVDERIKTVWSKKPPKVQKAISKKRKKHASASSAIRHAVGCKRIRPSSQLADILGGDPWPSSSAKGFQNVNLNVPCTGRFRSIPPECCELPTNQPESENDSLLCIRKCTIRLQTKPTNCAVNDINHPNSSAIEKNTCSWRATR
ncbi:unnamed protein product [Agarophyton chilense]